MFPAVRASARVALMLLACAAISTWATPNDPVPMPPAGPPRPPDIVLITIDALRRDHLSLYGYRRFTSPTIDAFARNGLTFTNAIAQAPYTKASIASLMTGLYPSAHKTVTSSVPFPDAMLGRIHAPPPSSDVLPSQLTTLAEVLQALGYRTLGLTANPFLSEPFGFNQGFDRFTFFAGPDFLSGERVVDAALAAVSAVRSQPLFLWVHLMEPHSPYVPPPWAERIFRMDGPFQPIAPDIDIPSWLVPGRPRDLREYVIHYDEEVAAADVNTGVLIRELGRLRDPANTLVILTSDHGEQFLDHGGWEHGSSLHEELIRVPLVIRVPTEPPGVVDGQIELIDLYSAIIAFARTHVWPLHDDHPAFAEIAGTQAAVRWRGWKLIRFTDGREQLFNLEQDPNERSNVASAEPAKLFELRKAFDRARGEADTQGRRVASEVRPMDRAILERLHALGYTAK